MKKILKSIGSVLAGIIVIVVLSIATDALLENTGVFPSFAEQMAQGGLFITWMLALALFYRTVYAFVGGYVTAMLAPSNPKKHVLILNCIGAVMGILGVIGGWNLSAKWYPISLVITSVIAVWYGGKYQIEHSKKSK